MAVLTSVELLLSLGLLLDLRCQTGRLISLHSSLRDRSRLDRYRCRRCGSRGSGSSRGFGSGRAGGTGGGRRRRSSRCNRRWNGRHRLQRSRPGRLCCGTRWRGGRCALRTAGIPIPARAPGGAPAVVAGAARHYGSGTLHGQSRSRRVGAWPSGAGSLPWYGLHPKAGGGSRRDAEHRQFGTLVAGMSASAGGDSSRMRREGRVQLVRWRWRSAPRGSCAGRPTGTRDAAGRHAGTLARLKGPRRLAPAGPSTFNRGYFSDGFSLELPCAAYVRQQGRCDICARGERRVCGFCPGLLAAPSGEA